MTTPHPPETPPIKLHIHDDTVMTEVTNPIFTGLVPNPTFEIIKTVPQLTENRLPKIPADLYKQAVSFLMWSQQEHKAEALVHGYCNPTRETPWIIEPPLQEPNGMTVRMATDPEDATQNSARIAQLEADGYVLRFTIHHHCTASAGQSETDKTDEHSKPSGFHFTIGNLDKRELSFHARAVSRFPNHGTVQYAINPLRFVTTPLDSMVQNNQWLATLRPNFFYTPHFDVFPEAWKDSIVKAVSPETAIAKLSPNKLYELMTQIGKMSAEDRSKAFAGHQPPDIPNFAWQGVKVKNRRAVFDKLKTAVEWWKQNHSRFPEEHQPTAVRVLELHYEATRPRYATPVHNGQHGMTSPHGYFPGSGTYKPAPASSNHAQEQKCMLQEYWGEGGGWVD